VNILVNFVFALPRTAGKGQTFTGLISIQCKTMYLHIHILAQKHAIVGQ